MSASITTQDGQTYTGVTVPAIIAREWGDDARLVKGRGEHGTVSVMVGDYVEAQVHEVVQDERGAPDMEALVRADEHLRQLLADVRVAQADRDRIVRAMVEHEEAERGSRSGVRGEVARALGVSIPAVAKMVDRG